MDCFLVGAVKVGGVLGCLLLLAVALAIDNKVSTYIVMHYRRSTTIYFVEADLEIRLDRNTCLCEYFGPTFQWHIHML